MEDAQAFLGNPSVGFLEMLLIGAIAGWIAERVTESVPISSSFRKVP
jgi:hypothetical protein